MKKIIIIGKKSFVGSHLYKKLKNVLLVKAINYKLFFKISDDELSSTDIIINCSINKDYIYKKYLEKNDNDFQISKRISKFHCKMIFLSSRKVYQTGDNLSENSKLRPKCKYSINKLNTERKLTSSLKKRVLILKIFNIIGFENSKYEKKKIHKTFGDIFFSFIKKNIIFDNGNDYKDFISIDKFCEIVILLIKKKAYGVYNVSVGEKVYLNNLIEWLNSSNRRKFETVLRNKNYKSDSFFLNNRKLMKKINIKNSVIQLKKDCKKISNRYFV